MEPINKLQEVKYDIKDVLSETKTTIIHGFEINTIPVTFTSGMSCYASIIRNEYNKLNGVDLSWIYDSLEEARCNYLLYNS